LIADLGGKRTLPLADSPAARREEIAGLLLRAGRRVRFADDNEQGVSLQGAP